MKTLCTFAATLLLVIASPAATRYIVESTTTNRVMAPTQFSLDALTNSSAGAWRTLLSVPPASDLTTVSNSVNTLQIQLPGYATNYGASLTNAAITGGTVTSQTNSDLTASRALVSDANKKLSSSAVTSTELGYVSGVTSAIQTQLDAKATVANLTTVSNTVTTQGNTLATNTALLNGNNTFTGTNNFTGPVIITNAASTISGNGAGLTNISIPNNNIGIRLLWSSPTNIYIPKMYPADGVSTFAFTNNGLVNMATQWFSFTIPPLLGSNSQLVFSALRQTTNANQFNGNMAIYIGPNTNYVGYLQPFPTSSSIAQNFNFTSVLANCGNFTNQITIALSPASSGITNYFDSTVSNTVYVGFFLNGVTGYRSNDVLIGFCAQEVFRP